MDDDRDMRMRMQGDAALSRDESEASASQDGKSTAQDGKGKKQQARSEMRGVRCESRRSRRDEEGRCAKLREDGSVMWSRCWGWRKEKSRDRAGRTKRMASAEYSAMPSWSVRKLPVCFDILALSSMTNLIRNRHQTRGNHPSGVMKDGGRCEGERVGMRYVQERVCASVWRERGEGVRQVQERNRVDTRQVRRHRRSVGIRQVQDT